VAASAVFLGTAVDAARARFMIAGATKSGGRSVDRPTREHTHLALHNHLDFKMISR
jgi:hypothetical protein